MRNGILKTLILCGLFYTSCDNDTQASNKQVTRNNDAFLHSKEGKVDTAATNAQGETLHMLFDTVAHTALFIFKQDSIALKQDTMASGIRYSNADYEYTEWHGEMTLKRGDAIIFSHTN